MSAIVEDGTGKPDAQVYQSEADTATQLETAGLLVFKSLAPGLQTLALILATSEGDRIAKAYQEENAKCFYGHPLNADQALFFPKENTSSVPSSAILACSLLAEAYAIEDTATTGFEEIPDNIAEVTLSEDVKIKFHKGGTVNPAASKLHRRAEGLLQSLCPSVSNVAILAMA